MYLNRSAILMTERSGKMLKDICNEIKKRTTDTKKHPELVVQVLKTFQTKKYVSDNFECGNSDQDDRIDDLYRELDIFINLDIRLISLTCFQTFEHIKHYKIRSSYYVFLTYLFEVAKNLISCETEKLTEFLSGKNRSLVLALLDTFKQEIASLTPVPNKNEDVYRLPSNFTAHHTEIMPNATSITNGPPTELPMTVATPKVRFQHTNNNNNNRSRPVTIRNRRHANVRAMSPPNTERIRQEFINGAMTPAHSTGRPPSPLERLMQQETSAPSSRPEYMQIFLNSKTN